ncbi:PaaX family transcriptional regulator C-terminal domain-containing protein [Rhodococcus wratislaviensis]|uniref:PaaX family transcriptional regulator n=1 Tax=Rhodococcus wratislaviensis TaxID=44752 RepID=UPI003515504C
MSTLLGDYWFWRNEHIPSAALIGLLGEFEISPSGARAAMQRLTARNLLVSSRSGRTTAYGLLPRSRTVLITYLDKLFMLGSGEPAWDGNWTVVTYSIPEDEKDSRRALREALRELKFGILYDAVWISPRDKSLDVLAVQEEIGVSVTVFRAKCVSPEHPVTVATEAFDLGALGSRYQEFIDTYQPVRESLRSTKPTPAQALKLRTAVMTDWRDFPQLDPNLPTALLPQEWPGRDALECCAGIYDSLGPLAEECFRSTIAEFDPGLALLSSHHTFAGARELISQGCTGHNGR